jgi:hypothetical protein
MGQQQLLLLVLGIVIVGIAAVAGIQAFSEGKATAERDAVVADASRVVADIQAWYFKPEPFGGAGEKVANFADLDAKWSILSRETQGANKYKTTNGCMNLKGESGKATLTVFSDTTCAAAAKIADIVIDGGTADDVSWTYN